VRPIKFRVWNRKKNEWEFGYSMMGGFHLFGELHILGYLDIKNFNDYQGEQFTGLKDRNGKEIYEGDRLKQFPGFGCEWEQRIGIVEYQGASFWFTFEQQSIILDDHDCQFEIIGNIHE
jgi:uncharacterized phage protein (TIGR01671 family)